MAPAGLIEAYADRLYDYCRSHLSVERAESVARATLLQARGDPALQEDPRGLRAEVYARARAACLDEETGPRGELAAEATDDGRPMALLVTEGLGGLGPVEREALDLSVRHELRPDEVGRVLGVDAEAARRLLAGAEDRLERWMAAVVLARDGRSPCVPLSELVRQWLAEPTPALRAQLSRHVRFCEVCDRAPRLGVPAQALLRRLPLRRMPVRAPDDPDEDFWAVAADESDPESRLRVRPLVVVAAASTFVVGLALVMGGESDRPPAVSPLAHATSTPESEPVRPPQSAGPRAQGTALRPPLFTPAPMASAPAEPPPASPAPRLVLPKPTAPETAVLTPVKAKAGKAPERKAGERGQGASARSQGGRPTGKAPAARTPSRDDPPPKRRSPVKPKTPPKTPPKPRKPVSSGRLALSTAYIGMGSVRSAPVTITAVGGPVSWSASGGGAFASPGGGSLGAGQSRSIRIVVSGCGEGSATVVFSWRGGSRGIRVVWDRCQ
ncbi:hypothetical protein D5H75_18235 [Bailinhaonella thermotolerans]|uniref:Sigma-70 family RNA polymerase sigma factor n=1 Tax=Bailinhaonella thermotolerans TaxID=1070861 RepID=A0A3A4BKM5_9ACTN|nr:hypothetical protein D5H75_18235 [Bailinhaonella thermotolerans]